MSVWVGVRVCSDQLAVCIGGGGGGGGGGIRQLTRIFSAHL